MSHGSQVRALPGALWSQRKQPPRGWDWVMLIVSTISQYLWQLRKRYEDITRLSQKNEKQCGAGEARGAHNSEVNGSKPFVAI